MPNKFLFKTKTKIFMKNKITKFNLLLEVHEQLTKDNLIIIKGGSTNRCTNNLCMCNTIPDCGCPPK